MRKVESSSNSQSRRLGSRVAAIAALLAVLGSALVVGSPAQAAPGDPVDPGLPAAAASSIPISSWVAGGTSAFAPLPANMSGLGSALINAPGQAVTVSDPTTTTAKDPRVPTGCLSGGVAAGYTAECLTNTMTMTFNHPVVNPIVGLASGVVYTNGSTTQCSAMWQDITFTSVNGVPAANQVTPESIDPTRQTFANNRLSYNPSYFQSTACGQPSLAYLYFTVGGLVSSLTFTYTTVQMITLNVPGTPVPDLARPNTGVWTAVYLPAADLSVAKTGPTTVQAGSPVSWQITVTNQGGSGSPGFVVHDAVPAGVTSPVLSSSPPGCSLSGSDLVCSDAAPGWTASQNASVSTFADLSGGDAQATIPSVLAAGATFGPIVITGTAPATPTTLTNTVSVSGTKPDEDTSNNTSTATTDVIAAPGGIQLTKSGGLAAGATGAAGDTVDYTFAVKNTGTVPLSGVSVADPLPGLSALSFTWPGTPGTLLPGETATATATYVLTQADVDAGSVVNTATATGTDPSNATVTGDGTTTVDVSQNPTITLTKTGGLAAGASGAVGDTVDYAFAAENTGNVTMTGVTIADPLPGLSAITYNWPGTPGTLLPGQIVTASATYVLTQADINAGSVVNTATATGTDPGNGTVTGNDTTTVDVPQNPAITLTKTGGLAAGASGAVGDTVDYAFAAENTGNVTLTGVTVADPLPGLSAITYTWPGTPGTLLPGQIVTASATYVLTQADVDAGSVVNTATATGTDPGNGTVTGNDTTTVDVTPSPGITLLKTGGLAAGATGAVGDTVDYTFEARNTGNVTMTGVTIADPLPGLSALTYNWPGAPGILLPGQIVTASATYVLTQADVNAGSVVNTATATGTDPANGTVTGGDTTTVDVPQNSAITLTKTGGLAAGATGAVGDTVDYAFAVKNSGTVTLTGVSVADPLPGLSALSFTWPGTPGTLLPGETATATATYVLTQADVDAGSVVNSATATGTDPDGGTVTGNDTTTVDVPQNPAITLTKTGGLAAGAAGAAGDTVEYSFAVKNTGNVTMTGVTIADPLPGLSALTFTWPGPAGTLLPGESATATATYVLTQADVNAGSVVNSATATGTDPDGGTVTGDDTTTVSVTPAPAITLAKTGGLAAGASGAVGDTIDYTFEASNAGNVTLTGVTIADPLPGLSPLSYNWPGVAGTLLPGQTVTASATYVLTQADIDAGSVVNTATATGTGPGGDPVTGGDTTTVEVSHNPAMTLVKTGGLAAGAAGNAGDRVDFGFTATNTGNVTLTGVTIVDTLPGLSEISYRWPGTPGTLTPGQSVDATATYVLTAADVRGGQVANTATVTGVDPRDGSQLTVTSNRVVIALGGLADTGSIMGPSVLIASLIGLVLILLGLTSWFARNILNRRRKATE